MVGHGQCAASQTRRAVTEEASREPNRVTVGSSSSVVYGAFHPGGSFTARGHNARTNGTPNTEHLTPPGRNYARRRISEQYETRESTKHSAGVSRGMGGDGIQH